MRNFLFLIGSFALCVGSSVNVCPAMIGNAESVCGSDSRCTGTNEAVCCGKRLQARLRRFKREHKTEIPKLGACRNLFKWILNSGLSEYVSRKHLTSSCTRQDLLSGQPMGMIVHAIEVLTTVPTTGAISLEYIPDPQWRNLEFYSELVRDLWNLEKCHDMRGIAQNDELADYIQVIVGETTSVRDEKWLISAFLQYCSIDLYDELVRLKQMPKEALELFPFMPGLISNPCLDMTWKR